MTKITVAARDATKVVGWMYEGRGLAQWNSVNMSNMGASWLTPANDEEGQPMPPPSWESARTPSKVTFSPAEVVVLTYEEVARFYVETRVSGSGLYTKLTYESTKDLDAALKTAGDGAVYEFDYETQEAVVFALAGEAPLPE